MDRIAYGLNMDMHMDQMHYQKLDQNLSEDIGKPNKNQWVLIILKQRVTTWTISNRHIQHFWKVEDLVGRRFSDDCILDEDISKPNNNHNLINSLTKG